MDRSAWLTIGKVTGVHGLAGILKVWSFADSIDTFAPGRQVRLVAEENESHGTDHTIVKASAQKKGILLTLTQVTDRTRAEALVGNEILMEKAQLPELEEDTWYWQDLFGLEVIDLAEGNLGRLDRFFPTGARDIMVVKNDTGKEVLIPMDAHFVQQVDLEKGVMTVTLPKGFILE